MVALLVMSCGAWAGTWQPLGVFEGENANASWQSEQGPATRASTDVGGKGPGLRLICPLATADDRCSWDADLPLDLSGVTAVSLSIRATRPAAVARCSLYFRSGDGWYAGWFTLSGDDWQTVELPCHAFGTEGAPAGWGAIQGMRISLWKGKAKDTIVELAGLRGRCDDIIVIRNSHAQTLHPDELPLIRRTSERTVGWLREIGITAGLLDDRDVVGGLPPQCRLVVLPYNPDSPDSTLAALTGFAAGGGKIIAAYNLPDALAPVLGLAGKEWAPTGPTAPFTAMRFTGDTASGIPASIRQNSWNASVPKVTNATVLAYWEDAAGVMGDLPAVTINSNGVFISHILTNIDRDQKMQLLLALTARLLPDKKADLARGLMERSARLFSLPNWEETRGFIMETAETHDRVLSGMVRLDAVDRYRQGTTALMHEMPFGDLLLRADVTRRLVQETYFNVVADGGVDAEFRGLWCHAADGVPGMTWRDSVAAMKQSGFNVLLPNMLWPGVAYYPSAVVPTASDVQEHGDLLAPCLAACREHDIELHLWKVCWNLLHASPELVAQLRTEQRLQQTTDGKELLWLCPSDPRNRDFELNAAVEAVKTYAVDGFHFDYIRYPGPESCYCPGCHERFTAATCVSATNWPGDVTEGDHREAFLKWRRDQITTFVAGASEALRATRDGISISAAVFPSWPSTCDSIGQDWVTWAKEGYVDFLCPMNYVSDDAEAKTLIAAQLAAVDGTVPVYPGLGPSAKGLPPEQVVHQVDLVRGEGAKGFVLFELDRDLLEVHLPALRAGAMRE
jgi:uncharacterized lipoprotein YddW (UPF0748 family)